jgi:hypothetical protein
VTEAASPGPWDYGYPDYDRDDNWGSHKRDPYSERGGFHIIAAGADLLRGKGVVAGKWDYESGGILTEPDAAFIATARTAMPALLDENGRLQRELAEAERLAGEIAEQRNAADEELGILTRCVPGTRGHPRCPRCLGCRACAKCDCVAVLCAEVADLREQLAEAERTIRGYEAARVRREETE